MGAEIGSRSELELEISELACAGDGRVSTRLLERERLDSRGSRAAAIAPTRATRAATHAGATGPRLSYTYLGEGPGEAEAGEVAGLGLRVRLRVKREGDGRG